MRCFIYAIITGLLMGLSWPTNGNSYLLFIGFIPLLHSIEILKKKEKKSNIFIYY